MKLNSAKATGRLGMNYVERVVLAAECKPIPVPEDLDTGIDGFIEFPGEIVTLVAFQVKRGSSFFDNFGAKYQANRNHLAYWMRYPLPVVLVIIRDDESVASWMDARQYVRDRPAILDAGPFVLRPPSAQQFDVLALNGPIRSLARPSGFGEAVSALCDADAETRISALSLCYRFRNERRAPFCLSAALRCERDSEALTALCDFYSRFMSHPELPFGVDHRLSEYARSLLSDLPRSQLLNILTVFNDSDEYGDWSGAQEIYSLNDDMVWDRHSVIHRGTVQQGLAEIVRAGASSAQLLSVVGDPEVPIGLRRASVALLGYLGHRVPLSQIDHILHAAEDASLHALLTWLRYWLVAEATEDGRINASGLPPVT